jgi:hypothetical protein
MAHSVPPHNWGKTVGSITLKTGCLEAIAAKASSGESTFTSKYGRVTATSRR